MKSLYLSLAALMLIPFAVFADNNPDNAPAKPKTDANITGHVESASTKEHLPYINIIVKGTTIGVMTDATGHFFLKDLPVGTLTLEASAIGYKKTEQKVTMVAGKTIEVNFLLEEEALLMDEVVVSATRNETTRREAPVVVNIASAKLFTTTAATDLTQVMNFQPGVRVENNCGNCGTTQLRINGLEGQYSQVLLDSRPIFSSLAGVYGLEQLPVGMIERVEVIRGGGSALFGASAIGGVVNIITKEPLRNSVSLANNTNILPGGKFDVNTSLNASFVSDDHKAGVYVFGMVKDRSSYDRNGDGFTEVPVINSETVGFRSYYRTGHNSRLTAEYHHIHEFRRGGNRLDVPPHEADITEQLEHRINGGGLSFDAFTPDYKHRWSLYSSLQNIKRSSYYGAGKDESAYGNTKDITVVGGGQYALSMDRLMFMPAELTAGVEYTYNDLDDEIVALERKLVQTTNVFGGFVQNEWKNGRFSALVGARLDKHSMMDNVVFSPRANVRWSPNDKLGFRASYSSGYRAPQTYNEDLHVEAVGGALKIIEVGEDLKPEYSHSISASADLYHNFGRMQGNLLVEGFYTVLKDVFTLNPTGRNDDGTITYWERVNGPGAKVQGINLEGKLGIPGVFDLQMGYTFQKSRYDEPDKWWDGDSDLTPKRRMPRAPDQYGYLTSTFDITKTFRASLFGNYTGPMLARRVINDGENETYGERTTPSFWDMGVKLAYTFKLGAATGLELNAGVKNIFDAYQRDIDSGPLKDAGYVYGPALPRMFFFGVKFSM